MGDWYRTADGVLVNLDHAVKITVEPWYVGEERKHRVTAYLVTGEDYDLAQGLTGAEAQAQMAALLHGDQSSERSNNP